MAGNSVQLKLQWSTYPTSQKVNTLIHERYLTPCRTTYIEYRSTVKKCSSIFSGTPPNSIGFHCKIVSFHSSRTPVVGGRYPSVSLKNSFF